MSMTGLKVFDNTLHKTTLWLDDIMETLQWQDRHQAYSALRAVLHALRDRLTPEEATHLGAQLPMLIRGFYYEGWHPSDKPLRYRHKEEFLAHVKEQLPKVEVSELEKIISAVFDELSKQMPNGEIKQTRDQLPADIRELWH
jgi:uncharacterized protein (DUF2267 family)